MSLRNKDKQLNAVIDSVKFQEMAFTTKNIDKPKRLYLYDYRVNDRRKGKDKSIYNVKKIDLYKGLVIATS